MTPYSPNLDPVEALRLRYIQAMAVVASSLLLLNLAVLINSDLANDTLRFSTYIPSIVFIFANGVAVLLVRRWGIRWGAFSLCSSLLIACLFAPNAGYVVFSQLAPAGDDVRRNTFLVTGLVTLISIGVLGNFPFWVAFNVIVLGRAAIEWLLGLAGIIPTLSIAQNTDRATNLIALAIVSMILRYFFTNIVMYSRGSLRSSTLLNRGADLGRRLSSLLSLNELLARAVEDLRTGFDYYHVQVFLADGNHRTASVKASTGEIGEKLLAANYGIEINNKTAVGRVFQRGEPIIRHRFDDGYSVHPLFEQVAIELAVPILDGNRIIGVLDIHSQQRETFERSDIQVLQLIANQLAVGVRNARLFDEQALNANENKRLYLEAETKLREIQRLNQQLTKKAWAEFLQERQEIPGVTLADNQLQPINEWSESLATAVKRRAPIAKTNEQGQQVFAVPIILRGEVLGAIEIETENQVKENDTVEVMKSIAERLASSLENVRLLERTQADTRQKERINEIVERYQEINTVDELLRFTLTELKKSLGATEGIIRLGRVSVEPPAAESNGHLAQG
jgi:GAF domain-containing protein